ncbi:ArsR/SmtB family transcription factor [Eupransor demetentiae]|uniref:ArsR family (ArsR) n=1 Tax=Eupransor demetentiae TaxID=3109584 RepID=A0ABM9N6D9_9LACO|nr:ArsR family (ArsR) [Lactobacillaceae bacterium LMG 33000]
MRNDKVAEQLSIIFKLLASPQRLKILTSLKERPHNVSELVEETGMEQSALSHQLRLLRHAQVVAAQKRGRQVYYELVDSHILTLLDNAREHVVHVLGNMTHDEAIAKEKSEKSN